VLGQSKQIEWKVGSNPIHQNVRLYKKLTFLWFQQGSRIKRLWITNFFLSETFLDHTNWLFSTPYTSSSTPHTKTLIFNNFCNFYFHMCRLDYVRGNTYKIWLLKREHVYKMFPSCWVKVNKLIKSWSNR